MLSLFAKSRSNFWPIWWSYFSIHCKRKQAVRFSVDTINSNRAFLEVSLWPKLSHTKFYWKYSNKEPSISDLSIYVGLILWSCDQLTIYTYHFRNHSRLARSLLPPPSSYHVHFPNLTRFCRISGCTDIFNTQGFECTCPNIRIFFLEIIITILEH